MGREQTPGVFGKANVAVAVLLHALLFGTLWYLGTFEPEQDDATVIPIECLVVVHENLDGNEDEPPPTSDPVDVPDEPTVEPDPAPDPEPPPPDDVVIVPDDKPKPEPPKEEPKKVEPPKPKPPEKPKPTKEEIEKKKKEELQKRLEEIRKGLVKEPTPKPTPPRPTTNGKTDKRPPDWEKVFNDGYKPSNRNEGLDASESQRCVGLIYQAFYDKWNRPAWTPELKLMILDVDFDMGGNVTGYRLSQGSGDRTADATVTDAARRVGRVPGLTRAFLERNRTVQIRFEVKPM